ncbi:FISUMP domain-containing protein [Paludibacter sp.]|uniref:FISUMP domain-containing protein n=1 Tax=Paludibacter sp. TaxID=1898105 RepID=UPI001354FF37|nr:FISUMP domain-containing protein [Paludibacter sp.]MTK53109.1 TIR domain-containing protein [Paludibacter sp.]
MAHDVFISYSSKNKTTADAICHVLEEHEIRCWIAPRDIVGGQKYGDVIEEAIKNCKVFVIIFSEESRISPWVESELNLAFTDRRTIVPFKIDSSVLEGEMRLILNNKHWIEAYPNPELKFKDLVEAVSRSIGKPTLNETEQHSLKVLKSLQNDSEQFEIENDKLHQNLFHNKEKKQLEHNSINYSEEQKNDIKIETKKNKDYQWAIIASVVFLGIVCFYSLIKNNDNSTKNISSMKDSMTTDSSAVINVNKYDTGTFTDYRDGHIYKWVRIGEQVWMAENLAFKTHSGCWAYDNNENNAKQYGYLYNWQTAMKVVPKGWHIPTDKEWKILEINLNKNNDFLENKAGFSGLLAGCLNNYSNIQFEDLERGGLFYTATTDRDTRGVYYVSMIPDRDSLFHNTCGKEMGFSIRCVKNSQ